MADIKAAYFQKKSIHKFVINIDSMEMITLNPLEQKTQNAVTIESQINTADNFEDWLIENKAETDLDPNSKLETFVDNDGNLRYVENWLLVVVDNQSLTRKAGCVEIMLDFIPPTQEMPKPTENKMRFITDWKLLWNYLEQDQVDELASHAPLLRIYIEFFFHTRTAQFITLLAIYNITVTSTLMSIFRLGPIYSIVLNVVPQFVMFLIYLAMRVLYKGSFYGDILVNKKQTNHTSTNNSGVNDVNGENKRNNKEQVTYMYSVHWASTVKSFFVSSVTELKSFLTCKMNENIKVNHKISYYTLMNISLKFLTRHNGLTVKQINFNRWTYRITLLFLCFAMPFYLYFYNYYIDTSVCNGYWKSEPLCGYLFFTLVFTFGNVTTFLEQYFFVSSVVVALVGLAYGGEIAYRLSDSWMKRFEGLRRLPLPQGTDSLQPDSDDDEETSAETSSLLPKTKMMGNNSNSGSRNSSRMSSKHIKKDTNTGNNGNSGNSNDSNNNSSDSINSNSDTKMNNTTTSRSTDPESSPPNSEEYHERIVQLIPLIQRDATEHYLFLREFMNEAGRIWSIGLVGLFFVFLYIIISYIYAMVQLASQITEYLMAKLIMYMIIRFFVLIIYPIVSLSHANSFVYALQENFLIAAPEDFAIIGGRDIWLNFLTSAPAVWSVFGIWITWDKLFGFLWMLMSGVAAIMITYVSSDI